jgi:hypothetical protein
MGKRQVREQRSHDICTDVSELKEAVLALAFISGVHSRNTYPWPPRGADLSIMLMSSVCSPASRPRAGSLAATAQARTWHICDLADPHYERLLWQVTPTFGPCGAQACS